MLYFARLGDMVMPTALLSFLHRRFRRPCHVIGAGSWNSAVFVGNPDVVEVWSFGRHFPFPLTRHWPQVARASRESHPGPIYICEHHYRQLPRIRRMLALQRGGSRRAVCSSTRCPSTVHHSVDRLVNLGKQTPPALHATDYPVPPETSAWAPRLRVDNDDRVELDAWLRSQGWAGRPIIMVQPGNHRSMSRRRERWRRLQTDDKAWPIERWVSLLQKVHARMPEALIMLRGSHEEVKMLDEVKAAAGLDSVVVAGVGLRRLFALCEASHSMISVDTGPRARRRGVRSAVGCHAWRRAAALLAAAQPVGLSGHRCWRAAGVDARGPDSGVEPVSTPGARSSTWPRPGRRSSIGATHTPVAER